MPQKNLTATTFNFYSNYSFFFFQILDRLADLMTFGSLGRCPKCSTGQLVFRSGFGYQCLGYITDWTKCEAIYEKPKRATFKVPKELKTEYPFL